MDYQGIAIVTGATSFIASGLLHELDQKKYKIYAVVRPNSLNMYRIPKKSTIQIVHCELNELSKLPMLIEEDCDYFFHLGWETNEKNNMYLQNENVKYTLEAVQAAYQLHCTAFIGTGSQAEYGLANVKLTAQTRTSPITGYGMAKLCAGQMSRNYCAQLKIKHIWLRILSVYGPMDSRNTLIHSCIWSLLKKESIKLTAAKQIWDYLFIEDCAKAILMAAQKGKDGTVYVLGSGEQFPLFHYIEQIKQQIEPNQSLKYGDIPYNPDTPMFLSADIQGLKKDTGFLPEISFEEGIRHTINWVKMNL